MLRVALNQFGAIPALRPLQLIAELVVAEGLRKLALILEGFANGKAQVVSVDQGGPGHRSLHPGDFISAKSISLEIGEAPVRITKIRPQFGGAMI